MNLYQENILDHFEHPRNWGKLPAHNKHAHDANPLCGDTFDMELLVNENNVVDVKFHGHGCAISTAAASMLTEKIKGMSVNEIQQLERKDIIEMLGVELSHVRVKCAMLPLKVVKLALYQKD